MKKIKIEQKNKKIQAYMILLGLLIAFIAGFSVGNKHGAYFAEKKNKEFYDCLIHSDQCEPPFRDEIIKEVYQR